MKKIFLIFIILAFSLPCISNIFSISGNIKVSEISRTEFENAYKSSTSVNCKIRKKKSSRKKILKKFLLTDYGKKWKDIWEADIYQNYEIEHIHIGDYHFYILKIYGPIYNRTYILDDSYEVIPTEMLSGYGHFTLIDNQIIYAGIEEFDCDEYPLCRWYKIEKDNVQKIAELAEYSFDTFIPYWTEIPSFFSDTKGFSYIAISDKSTDQKSYFRIKIVL